MKSIKMTSPNIMHKIPLNEGEQKSCFKTPNLSKNSKTTELKLLNKSLISEKSEVNDLPESVDSGCGSEDTESIRSLNETADWNQVRRAQTEELKFIERLLNWIPVVKPINPDDHLDDTKQEGTKRKALENDKTKKRLKVLAISSPKSRVENYAELQRRAEQQHGDLKALCKKGQLTLQERKAEKKLKRNLAKLQRRKVKRENDILTGVKKVEIKVEEEMGTKPLMKEGQLVFSKFDFSSQPDGSEKKDTGKKKDLKNFLDRQIKEKEKIKELHEKGKLSEANKLKEKKAWKAALMRAEGKKVYDDADLLKKSLNRQKSKKKSSEKKWKERLDEMTKNKEEAQKKRMKNIKERRDTKIRNKVIKQKKKGHSLLIKT